MNKYLLKFFSKKKIIKIIMWILYVIQLIKVMEWEKVISNLLNKFDNN
jgi:hypothetical protein